MGAVNISIQFVSSKRHTFWVQILIGSVPLWLEMPMAHVLPEGRSSQPPGPKAETTCMMRLQPLLVINEEYNPARLTERHGPSRTLFWLEWAWQPINILREVPTLPGHWTKKACQFRCGVPLEGGEFSFTAVIRRGIIPESCGLTHKSLFAFWEIKWLSNGILVWQACLNLVQWDVLTLSKLPTHNQLRQVLKEQDTFFCVRCHPFLHTRLLRYF